MREAGIRTLEQNLATLASAGALRFVEQDLAVSLCEDMHQLSPSIVESRLAEGAEVEMEVIPMDVDNPEISSTARLNSPMVVDKDMLANVLGPPIFHNRETANRIVAIGLMWTAYGREIQSVEAATMMGKGNLHLTRQLSNAIKESAMMALI
ncbi:hypothetical protein Nepgr_023309 [Nepenthes gracilis]|uniref:Lon proteolytic domain-containing protein n=1 Tax=Nepenthes gracilis TaxID=150966 RepID=A0AAD3T3K1_NEPGR|nr:hypothetical protein Nepgr_023309 [Nepenthes gracilis]